jgi:hypothetical protein
MRDYEEWHHAYDDPRSSLSWRLGRVQRYLHEALDEQDGPVRIVSACSGDGRDVIGVLRDRADAGRVTATLLELHPAIAQAARDAAGAAGLGNVEVRTNDAGSTDAYTGAVPADVVLLVGIFGNISNADIERTIRATPGLCTSGATVVWSRGYDIERNDVVRGWFADAGFEELDYAEHCVDDDRTGLGMMRFVGDPVELIPGQPLFTFVR